MPVYYEDNAYLRIASSTTLATVLHIFVFAILSQSPDIPEKKTVTFELITQKQSKASKQSDSIKPSSPSTLPTEKAVQKKLQTQAANKNFNVDKPIDDIPVSKTQVPEFSEKLKSKDYRQPNVQTPSAPKLPSMPSMQAPELSGNSDFSSLFTSKQPSEQEEVHISTNKQLKQMTAYERRLLQKFLAARYYDKINNLLLQSKKIHKITLELTVFSNGSLKNATLVKASSNQTLNNAVRHTALSASPYPPPPKKDKKNGYKYRIDLEFKPF